MNIADEQYDMTYYLLGKLKVRAGLEAKFEVGLFSTDLDSIGFTAEAGVYVSAYGYFYYHLHFDETNGKKITKDGAIDIEIGAYIDVNFFAQAMKGRYSSTYNIFYDETPFWTTGNRYSVLDFATDEEDLPEVILKQYVRNSGLPDSLFSMKRQDLRTGVITNEQYNDESDFNFYITNSAFSYNPQTNLITVTPQDGQTKLMGEMIITFKNQSFNFTSEPIKRVIPLYWDNLRDGYVISAMTNGGSYVNTIVKPAGETFDVPQDPTKVGYVFAGWYANEEMTQAYTFPTVMPESDTIIYAKWDEALDTKYTVEHYKLQLGGSLYALADTVELEGRTNASVNAPTKTYTGFITPQQENVTILADGTAVLRYYYDLEEHVLTFSYGEVSANYERFVLKYGAAITVPTLFVAGYTFDAWDSEPVAQMGTTDLTYTALWIKNNDTQYRVEYYVQDSEGRYIIANSLNQISTTDSIVDVSTIINENLYAIENKISYRNVTFNGEDVDSVNIGADGKAVIKVYFERSKYSVTFKPENGGENFVYDLYIEQKLPTTPTVLKNGYIFDGWDAEIASVMGTSNLTYCAKWITDYSMPYIVEIYQETNDNETNDEYYLFDAVEHDNTQDAFDALNQLSFEGFTYNAEKTGDWAENATVNADGKRVAKVYYSRNVYTIYYGYLDELRLYERVKYNSSVKLMPYHINEISSVVSQVIVGWKEADGTEFHGRMPARDITVYAQVEERHFQPNTLIDTYQVIFVYYNFDAPGEDSWTERFYYYCELGSTFVAELEYDENYVLNCVMPQVQTIVVGQDANVINYSYNAKQINVNWELNDGQVVGDYDFEQTWQVGDLLQAPILQKTGHSYTWSPALPVRLQNVQEVTFTAVWAVESFTATFNELNGTKIIEIKGEYNSAITLPTPATLVGFTFTGNWLPYTPTMMPAENITFTPVYTKNEYAITYDSNSLLHATNNENNLTKYTVDSGTITLYEPTRTGYTFTGWFDNELFIGDALTTFTPNANDLKAITFYANWLPNNYAIIFDNSLKDSNQMENTQLFIYDRTQNLKSNEFVNVGYDFMGWATSLGGVKKYNNGESVSNLATSGTIRLFAVWQVITYTITYTNYSIGASANNNAVNYNIETADITISAPSNIYAGYEFLGWFNNNDKKVTTITKGSHGNVALTAKWAHAGVFNVNYVSTNDSTSTYKVVRTFPNDCPAVADAQKVYYRTVNGTAIGGTATAINFLHVGGEDVFLTFNSTDTEKTFEVKNENGNAAYAKDGSNIYYSTAYVKAGANLNYSVQLYKVVNTTGGCTGVLGSTTSYTRTLTVSSEYQMDITKYSKYFSQRFYEWDVEKNVEYQTNHGWYAPTANIADAFKDSAIKDYILATLSGVYWVLTIAVKEENNGDQYIKFTTNEGDSTSIKLAIGGYQYAWWHDCRLPMNEGSYTGHDTDGTAYNGLRIIDIYDEGLTYDAEKQAFKLGSGVTSVKITFAAGGEGDRTWYFKNLTQFARAYDEDGPTQIGIAPLSFGKYKKNDKVKLSVVYDEIVDDTSNVSVDNCTLNGLSLKDFKLVGGEGTNVLVFEATVDSNEFEIDPNYNNYIIGQKLNIKGNVIDIWGNSN